MGPGVQWCCWYHVRVHMHCCHHHTWVPWAYLPNHLTPHLSVVGACFPSRWDCTQHPWACLHCCCMWEHICHMLQLHHLVLTSSSPLTSSFMSPNMVHMYIFLPSPLTLPFILPGVTTFVSIIASLVVTMAILGFVSLAGGLVVVWMGLNMMEASVSHAVRFVVGVGVVGDSSCLIVVVGRVEVKVSCVGSSWLC